MSGNILIKWFASYFKPRGALHNDAFSLFVFCLFACLLSETCTQPEIHHSVDQISELNRLNDDIVV